MRLTRVDEDGTVLCIKCVDEECNGDCLSCEHDIEAMNKLAEYEDLEEQGLLLRLPCKVGDVLWCIDNKKVESFVVKEFRICTYKIYRIEIYFENASGFGLCLFNGTLDEGWYRTKKEAEQAMERMEKENG